MLHDAYHLLGELLRPAAIARGDAGDPRIDCRVGCGAAPARIPVALSVLAIPVEGREPLRDELEALGAGREGDVTARLPASALAYGRVCPRLRRPRPPREEVVRLHRETRVAVAGLDDRHRSKRCRGHA